MRLMLEEIPFGFETDTGRICQEMGICLHTALTCSHLCHACIASAARPKDCAETAPLAAGRVVDIVYLLILIMGLFLILLV